MQKARDSRAVGIRPRTSSEPAEDIADLVAAGFKNVSSSSIAVYSFDSSLRQKERSVLQVNLVLIVSPKTPALCFLYTLLQNRGRMHSVKKEVFRYVKKNGFA